MCCHLTNQLPIHHLLLYHCCVLCYLASPLVQLSPRYTTVKLDASSHLHSSSTRVNARGSPAIIPDFRFSPDSAAAYAAAAPLSHSPVPAQPPPPRRRRRTNSPDPTVDGPAARAGRGGPLDPKTISPAPFPKRRRLASAGYSMLPDGASTATAPAKAATANGLANGASPVPSFTHSKEEITRILIQGLADLGYPDAADTLRHESGYSLETPAVEAFRTAILDGRWRDAELSVLYAAVDDAHEEDDGDRDGDANPDNSHGLVLVAGASKPALLFAIRTQKFVECLDARNLSAALTVLQHELTPLHQDMNHLHSLSRLLMCPPDRLRSQVGWDGSVVQCRRRLLAQLSRSISPSVMMPDHRLNRILDYVRHAQVANCPYHNTPRPPSLLLDHRCDRSRFPLYVSAELTGHTDEAFYLAFSHNGHRLATTSRDATIIIYDVPSFHIVHRLIGHNPDKRLADVTYVAWSPDDSRLLTCSKDRTAKLWNADVGVFLPSFCLPILLINSPDFSLYNDNRFLSRTRYFRRLGS